VGRLYIFGNRIYREDIVSTVVMHLMFEITCCPMKVGEVHKGTVLVLRANMKIVRPVR
jgi:hypothetical protein